MKNEMQKYLRPFERNETISFIAPAMEGKANNMKKQDNQTRKICIHSFDFEECKLCQHAEGHEEIFKNSCGCAQKRSTCMINKQYLYDVHCVSIH